MCILNDYQLLHVFVFVRHPRAYTPGRCHGGWSPEIRVYLCIVNVYLLLFLFVRHPRAYTPGRCHGRQSPEICVYLCIVNVYLLLYLFVRHPRAYTPGRCHGGWSPEIRTQRWTHLLYGVCVVISSLIKDWSTNFRFRWEIKAHRSCVNHVKGEALLKDLGLAHGILAPNENGKMYFYTYIYTEARKFNNP